MHPQLNRAVRHASALSGDAEEHDDNMDVTPLTPKPTFTQSVHSYEQANEHSTKMPGIGSFLPRSTAGTKRATKFTISDDITVEGKKLPKGSYSLYTVPGEEEWDIIFYNEVNISGVPKVMDQAKETARIKVKAELLTYTTETFLIDINSVNQDNASMNIMWENTIVPIHLQFDVDSRVMKNIDKVLAGPSSDDYYQAARYYFDSGKDLTQAVGWIQKANQMDAKFWKLRVESMILAKLGRKSEAIEAAMKSKTMAAAEGNEEYVRMNEEAIKELSK